MNFKSFGLNKQIPHKGKFRSIPLLDISPDGWLKELLLGQRDRLGLHHEESGTFVTLICLALIKHPFIL